jgi:hypothetical protein
MLIFDFQVWPCPWRCVTGCCAWHIVSLLWTIVVSIYKIPSKLRKLWTGHDIDNVDLEWASATLTLVAAHDTSSYSNKRFCQVISNSFNKYRTRKCDGWTDRRTFQHFGFRGFLFAPPLKQWKNVLFRPQTLFFVWEMLLKMWPLFRHRPPSKCYIRGLPEGGYAPFCLGGLKGDGVPLIAKKILDMWQAKNGLRSILA